VHRTLRHTLIEESIAGACLASEADPSASVDDAPIERVVSAARGRVLEIGVGSGLNLPLYEAATHVIALEPSAKLLAMARTGGLSIELVEGVAESIPLPDHSVDTVVSTWTLCSIPDVTRALTEMRRVLTPGDVCCSLSTAARPSRASSAGKIA